MAIDIYGIGDFPLSEEGANAFGGTNTVLRVPRANLTYTLQQSIAAGDTARIKFSGQGVGTHRSSGIVEFLDLDGSPTSGSVDVRSAGVYLIEQSDFSELANNLGASILAGRRITSSDGKSVLSGEGIDIINNTDVTVSFFLQIREEV